ncbi:MAG: BtpA/SgcQ family protein [Akkermansiaceae bacterium]|nr:BtpA/SgcQ family protein [Akkermansiaceae bacterium]
MLARDAAVNWDQKRLIGVVHLKPLPGSPRWGGSMEEVCAAAAADAKAYESGGADGIMIENFGDLPFTREAVPPETVAGMTAAARAVREAGVSLPIGFNVLRNDVSSALGIAAACDGAFVRVNVHTGAVEADQGIIQGEAFTTMRKRAALCPDVQVWADVMVKHAVPIGDLGIAEAARDTFHRGLADALIVSGVATGAAADTADLRRVREACPHAPLLVGSGATLENAAPMLECADGLIVASSLKVDGILTNPVDVERVQALREVVSSL